MAIYRCSERERVADNLVVPGHSVFDNFKDCIDRVKLTKYRI